MKSRIRTFALRFAATVLLFAPAVAVQAQGTSPPPPQPAQPASATEPPIKHAITNEIILYDAAAEARKAQLRATEQRDSRSTLCPPPYRMTARDGCQR